jgi:hypothetical protein
MSYFTLPAVATDELTQAMRLKVKESALKKMATQFQTHKKTLYQYYLKEKKTPEFTDPLQKQPDHWDAFVEYKESEEAKQRSKKNNENAAKEIYHHKMGTGGYKTAEPKWDQAEAAMRAQGITPATQNWSRRTRNWVLWHGSSYDPKTGELIHNNEKIIVPHKDIVEGINEVIEGKFHPDKENDELTKALKNKEHPG